MVNLATIRGYMSPVIVAAAGQPLLQRLEPERRVKVLAALAALVLGVVLVASDRRKEPR